MAKSFQSSIGKKVVQAVSGAFLVIFLLLHGTINFFSVIDTFTGKYGVAAVDNQLFSAGDGLFQLGCDFMSLPIVTIMVPILALGFLIHIVYALILTWGNLRARGGISLAKRYESGSKGAADSVAAKNMFVLGIIVLGVIFFHLSHFWADMQLQEFVGGEAKNPYFLLNQTFGSFVNVVIYIIWFSAIWLHLEHGIWSMFQTVGWNNQIWLKRLKVLGTILASLIWLCFTSVAVNAFLHAKGII